MAAISGSHTVLLEGTISPILAFDPYTVCNKTPQVDQEKSGA
jgi:hypothetical protein